VNFTSHTFRLSEIPLLHNVNDASPNGVNEGDSKYPTQLGLDCHVNLLILGLVNLKMLDLSDSEVENAGLRYLTGKSSSRNC